VARSVPPTMARFFGMLTNVDENVGRLRARLREWGLAESTIGLGVVHRYLSGDHH